ncbi:MAG: SNF2-related protein, partial [bacterium]
LLPVDLANAWDGERIRVILEALVDGQPPTPLDAVSKETVYSVYEADNRILSMVEQICGGETPGMWLLDKSRFTEFLECLIGHERVMLGRKERLQVASSSEPSELHIEVFPNGDMHLHFEQRSNGKGTCLYAPESAWRLADGRLELLGKLPAAYKLLRQRDVVLPRSAIGHFFQNELPQLERSIKVVLGPRCQSLRFEKLSPTIRVELDGSLAGLSCKVEAVYGSTVHVLQGLPGKMEHSHNGWTPDPKNPLVYFVRDREAEQNVQRGILSVGFQPGQRQTEFYALSSENRVGAFLSNVLPRWRARWEIVFSPRMDGLLEKCDWICPEIAIDPSGQDWLALDVQYAKADGKSALSRDEVQRLLQTGASHHRLANGRIALLPTDSVQQFNEALFDAQVEANGSGGWQMNKRYAAYLQGVLESNGWKISSRSTWQPATNLERYEELALTESAVATLRAYQRVGVNWLHYLARNSFGGILADEMGLGKTIQTLIYLDYRKKQGLSSLPSLVVGPTSIVQNWMAEAARFTPDLSILALHGVGRRALLDQVKQTDMVVTSYSLLRRDIADLQKFEFDTVVLDEAQNIKNRASQNAHAAKALNAKNRLVLTGTPMENSLLDLWSIFDFLMPGYLGPAAEFKNRYEIPIAKQNDEKALNRLRQRVRPFVLRRTKSEVAKDLPSKIEQVAFCELTEEQKGV